MCKDITKNESFIMFCSGSAMNIGANHTENNTCEKIANGIGIFAAAIKSAGTAINNKPQDTNLHEIMVIPKRGYV